MGNIDENQKVDVTPALKNNKFPKYLYLMLGVVVVLIVIVIELNVYLKYKSSKNPRAIPTEKILSSLETAVGALAWVDKQRDERGVYTVGSKCNGDGCEYMIPTNRSAFSVLWARNKLINKNNDEKEKEIFLKDLDVYLNQDIVKLIQPNSWNCLYMYRILEESSWGDEVNNKIKNVCLRSQYELSFYNPQPVEELSRILKERVTKLMENKENLVGQNNNEKISGGQQSYEEDPVDEKDKKYLYLSADQSAQYLISNFEDKKVYEDSMISMILSIEDYEKKQSEMTASEGCYVGVAGLLMNKVEKDQVYLDLAKLVFEQQSKKMDIKSEKDSSVCGVLADMLYKKTGEINYKNKLAEINEYWKNNNYDEKEGGFFTMNEGYIVKKIKFNGIFTGLLIE